MNAWTSVPIPLEVQVFTLYVALGGMSVAAMILAAAWLLRRGSEPLRYGVLLAGVVALLFVPALVGIGQSLQQVLPWSVAEIEAEIVKVPAERLPEVLARSDVDPPDAQAVSPVPLGQYLGAGLVLVWALGVAIGLRRLVSDLWKQRRALVGRPWQATFWTAARRAQLAKQLGLAAFPEVRLSPAAPMPMVIGIWRPMIVLPQPPPDWQQSQWEAVLLHEAAHIARRDPWAVLLQRFACVLFWWCPLVYLLARRLNELREHICDEYAVQGSCDRLAYAELLVESAEQFLKVKALPVPLGLLESTHGGLAARVTRLLAKEKSTMPRLSLSSKVLGAGLLVAACLLTTAGTALSGGQPPPQKKIQIKIIVDGKEIDLGDAQLWDLIAAAQQKAAAGKKGDEKAAAKPDEPASKHRVITDEKLRVHVRDGEGRSILIEPGTAKALSNSELAVLNRIAAKQLAFSPDGKVLVHGHGTRLQIIDATTGQVISEVGGKDAPHVTGRVVVRGDGAKHDPRIEDLVKQAEAIKPGAGAAVREALQGHGGRNVIVLSIDDGKVLRLTGEDAKKALEKGIRVELELEGAKRAYQQYLNLLGHQKSVEKMRLDVKPKDGKPGDGKHTDTKPTDAKPAKVAPQTAPQSSDIEALIRQVERMNAELNELRRRLDAGKK
jgi:beta-lactamase regulating signal transducer with metallopeptidase domain